MIRALAALVLLVGVGCATLHDVAPTIPTQPTPSPDSQVALKLGQGNIEIVERGRLNSRSPVERAAMRKHTATVLGTALGADDLGPTLETDVELEFAQRPDSEVLLVRMQVTSFLPDGRSVENQDEVVLVPPAEACVADGLEREGLLFIGAALGSFATWSLAPVPGVAGCALLSFGAAALGIGGASWAARGLWPTVALRPRFSDAYQKLLVDHAQRVRAVLKTEAPKPAAADDDAQAVPEAVRLDEAGAIDPGDDHDAPSDPMETPY